MKVYVDATTLVSLGSIDKLDLLLNFDGEISVPPDVREEVTTEPAHTNLERFFEDGKASSEEVPEDALEKALEILSEEEVNGDAQIVGSVLANEDVAVVSDDRRVRTVARSLGADVTGTVGVVVRAVSEGMQAGKAKDVVRRIDGNGLHMTAELREKAYELIEETD